MIINVNRAIHDLHKSNGSCCICGCNNDDLVIILLSREACRCHGYKE